MNNWKETTLGELAKLGEAIKKNLSVCVRTRTAREGLGFGT